MPQQYSATPNLKNKKQKNMLSIISVMFLVAFLLPISKSYATPTDAGPTVLIDSTETPLSQATVTDTAIVDSSSGGITDTPTVTGTAENSPTVAVQTETPTPSETTFITSTETPPAQSTDTPIPNPTAPAFSLDDGAVLIAHLDDALGSSTFSDYSGKGNDCVCDGTTCPAAETCGQVHYGAAFDGLDDSLSIPQTDLPDGLQSRSMCAWAKTDDSTEKYRWIASYGSVLNGRAMFIGLNGPNLIGGSYGDDIWIPDVWKVGEWHHICLTYDGATAKLYADGQEKASIAKHWDLLKRSANIGKQVTGTEFWSGAIDEVRIYNRAITSSEIAQLSQQSAACIPPTPNPTFSNVLTPTTTPVLVLGDVALFHFDEAAGTTQLVDSSSSHNNAMSSAGSCPSAGNCGTVGKSIQVDGVSQAAQFSDAALPDGLSARTMCVWAKTENNLPGYRWIASYGSATPGQAMFIGLNESRLIAGGYGDDLAVDWFWDINVWHHLCLAYDGTTATLYSDGQKLIAAEKNWDLQKSGTANIGNQVNGQEFWKGSIDELRIFDRALSDEEVRQISSMRNYCSIPTPLISDTATPVLTATSTVTDTSSPTSTTTNTESLTTTATPSPTLTSSPTRTITFTTATATPTNSRTWTPTSVYTYTHSGGSGGSSGSCVQAKEFTITNEDDIANQDSNRLDVYSSSGMKEMHQFSRDSHFFLSETEKSYMGFRFHGEQIDSRVKILSASIEFTNNASREQWINQSFQLSVEKNKNPQPFSCINDEYSCKSKNLLLPSQRTVLSNSLAFEGEDRLLGAAGSLGGWALSVTQLITDLKQSNNLGSKVVIIAKGSSSKWGRGAMYYTLDGKIEHENLPKLKIVTSCR
ncbi:MAG: LamG domain-containing protein [bacterium]